MEKIGQHMARGEQVRIVLENLDGEKFVHYGTPIRAKRKSNSIGFGFDSKGRDNEAAKNDPEAKPLPEQIGTLYTVRGDSRFVGVNNSTPNTRKQQYRVISVESAREFLEKQDPKERPELAAKLHPVSVMRYEIVRDPDLPQQAGRNTTSPYSVEVYKKLDDPKTPDVDERGELLYRIPLINGSGTLHPSYIEGARQIGGDRWLLDVGAKWDHGLNKPVIAIKADYNRDPSRAGNRYQTGLVNLDRIVLDKEGWPERAEMEVGADHTFERPKKVELKVPSVDMSRFQIENNPYGRPGVPSNGNSSGASPGNTPGNGPRHSTAPKPSRAPGDNQAPTQNGANPNTTQSTQVRSSEAKLSAEQLVHYKKVETQVEMIAEALHRDNPKRAAAVQLGVSDYDGNPFSSITAIDGRVQRSSELSAGLEGLVELSNSKAMVDGAFWGFEESGVVAFMSRNSNLINISQVDSIDETYRAIYTAASRNGVEDMRGKWFDVAVDTRISDDKIKERVSPLADAPALENGFTRTTMQGTLTSSGEFILRVPETDTTYSYVGYAPTTAVSNGHPPRLPKPLRGRVALSGGDYDPETGHWSSGKFPEGAPHYTALSNPSTERGPSSYPLYLAPSQGGPNFKSTESSLSLLRVTGEVHQTMTALMFGDKSKDDVIASLGRARESISELTKTIQEGSVSRVYAEYLSEKLLPSVIENLANTSDSSGEIGTARASLRRIETSMLNQSAEMLGFGQIETNRMKEFYELLSANGFGKFDQDLSLLKNLSIVLDRKGSGIAVVDAKEQSSDGP
jgi:hypothetical protein